MEFFLFMLFSLIESIALFSISFALYRLKFTQYLSPSLIMMIIINLVSFYLRKEVELADYAPVAILVLLVLFMMAVVKMPAFWALFVSLSGILFFGLLQTVIIQLSVDYLSLGQIHTYAWKGYFLQTLTGLLGYSISNFMYKRGIGFSFEFVQPLFKRVTLISMIVIILIALAFGAVLFIGNSYIASIIYFIGLAFLLYFALKKEVEDAGTGI
ncbi:hypothetical protein Back11_00560 [Paenibacillus baekrokdamisoli]|uniref:Uncharacterized protein n=1 Tax=Paenibacillus baekrokdamisoli TaxID=1712516 RepID=A0A3G9IYF5_9BACL|nr:hypothetical protein [Paenibacillus baekrokdamisoli]MBB3069317.1 hypothetical protein [Paenibacillus baekrokdamisoli]BBH18711.1 hypothetical protein Back11_00560 [Paenibacillus baekrokdamisoli]